MPESVESPFAEREAARYLAISLSTLRRWRRSKKGPAYFRVDNVIRYRKVDLDAFVTANTEAA